MTASHHHLPWQCSSSLCTPMKDSPVLTVTVKFLGMMSQWITGHLARKAHHPELVCRFYFKRKRQRYRKYVHEAAIPLVHITRQPQPGTPGRTHFPFVWLHHTTLYHQCLIALDWQTQQFCQDWLAMNQFQLEFTRRTQALKWSESINQADHEKAVKHGLVWFEFVAMVPHHRTWLTTIHQL